MGPTGIRVRQIAVQNPGSIPGGSNNLRGIMFDVDPLKGLVQAIERARVFEAMAFFMFCGGISALAFAFVSIVMVLLK